MKYYIVVQEWNYPCESGRDIVDDYDTKEEAMTTCRALAEAEVANFEDNIKGDALDPIIFKNSHTLKDEGYIVTSKMGLDDFYYATRIFEVNSLDQDS